MRTLLALALVLVACGRSDRPADPAAHDAAPSLTRATGPDPVVLRIARGGGRLATVVASAVGGIKEVVVAGTVVAFGGVVVEVVVTDVGGLDVVVNGGIVPGGNVGGGSTMTIGFAVVVVVGGGIVPVS